MRRILLYSPDVVGHPRVYCRVIADALAGEDCDLVIALGFTKEIGLAQSVDLHPLENRERVSLVETSAYSDQGRTNLRAEELRRLQNELRIDTTLFIEGDKSTVEFLRIARGEAPRLSGRNLAIFANTAEWYPGEDSFSGAPRRILAPTLRTTLGNLKRALLHRRDSPGYFFEKLVLGARVVDELLVKDERLAEWHGPPVYWMPEISRPASAPESSAEAVEYSEGKAALEAFLAANAGREPLLYFGDAAVYKGYDLFLQFVARHPSVCAFHAGVVHPEGQAAHFGREVEDLRARLRSEGRLLETDRYVRGERLKRLYFGAVRVYLTTHRLALSSATVIQALELGKPVLVPDRGLLGYRVRTNGLGDVYDYADLDDLGRKAERLWRTDLARFADPARSFWQRFSDESIRRFFRGRLLGS